MVKAVFLDRDGTIIEDSGYVWEREKVRFLPGVDRAIRQLNEEGYKVIVVTNQAGVARGYFSEEAVQDVNRYVGQCLAEKGAIINRFYYCPHHVDGVIEKYKISCNCRKPNPGMIEMAAKDFGISAKDSFLIGDKPIDVEAGRRAGCRTVLLAQPGQANEPVEFADHVAADLCEAVEWLLKISDGKKR